MAEPLPIQSIIQGGAVGIAVLMILYSGWKDKMYNKTLGNHLKHFTEAFDRNTKVIDTNNKIQGSLLECQRDVLKIMGRVEDKLDKM